MGANGKREEQQKEEIVRDRHWSHPPSVARQPSPITVTRHPPSPAARLTRAVPTTSPRQVFRRRQVDMDRLTPEEIERSRSELAELERRFLERVAQTNRCKSNSAVGGKGGSKDNGVGGGLAPDMIRAPPPVAPWMMPPQHAHPHDAQNAFGMPDNNMVREEEEAPELTYRAGGRAGGRACGGAGVRAGVSAGGRAGPCARESVCTTRGRSGWTAAAHAPLPTHLLTSHFPQPST